MHACRVLDVYTGKQNKLNDSALQTASNSSVYLRYSKADYNLTSLDGEQLTLPDPAADWGNFSLINLPGKASFPVITTAIIVSGSDLSQLGQPLSNQHPQTWICVAVALQCWKAAMCCCQLSR